MIKNLPKFTNFFQKAVLSVFLLFFMITPALAADVPELTPGEGANAAAFGAIQTVDKGTKSATQKGFLKRTLDQVKTWTRETLWRELKKSGDIAWRKALKYFLNTLAYDTATYLATGDKGQMPMFETQGWGGYLKNVADNTAGTFIEQLGKNSAIKFNLCNPNLRVMLRINLGLLKTYRPTKPACTFTQMTKNWDQALRSKNFLNDFQDMFNPWSNDLGVALTLQTGIESEVGRKVSEAVQERQEGQGFKAVKDDISGFIKTPARLVAQQAGIPLDKAPDEPLAYTGSVIADSIDIFINTLAGKLITKWMRQGLVTKFPSLTSRLDSLTDPNSQNLPEGAAGAASRMRTIVEPNFKVRADYDILAELVSCFDPNKAGPTDCVIDEKFRQAIEKKMTVGEAFKQGYLNGNGIFGFTSDGLEPKFNEGYPYRSMIILRKYRIIPVGWEVAAQRIKDCQNSEDQIKCGSAVDGTKNLADLVNCFSSDDDYGEKSSNAPAWCVGLVDPDWVLKAPQNFCKREGAGPQIISEQITGQGADSERSVIRDDAYCADEQSCIKDKADGSCQLYGYCTEERRKWDFNAKSCEPLYNTCQTFGSPDDQTVSYLENTLNFSFCNAGNAGCLGYCVNYDLGGAKFVCANPPQNIIHFNKQAQTCDKEDEGCHQFIRLNSGGGANLLINSGFEKALTIGGWDGFGEVSQTPYQGVQSIKMAGVKNHSVTIGAGGYKVAGESYTLSFYAKNCKDDDSFWLGDSNKSADLNAGEDWTRRSITYTYPASHNGRAVTFSIDSEDCLIDNIKLERGVQTTVYSEYGAASSLVHEKLLPAYLKDACYADKGSYYEIKDNAPEQCSDFARICAADEVGCELYTGVESEFRVPAKVIAQDYCPAECLGYNAFIQSSTVFDSSREADFMPKTAKTCSAEAVGCDQFTNLDEVAKGGEGVESYAYLRQCIKKSEADCGVFYTWEGSDETGYQLRSESLEKGGEGPKVTEADNLSCNAAIYGLPVSDPAYRPDCRQYYNSQGGVFYHLSSHTISCTDDCHPYRRTEINELTVDDCKAGCGPARQDCLNSCDTGDLCSAVTLAAKKNSCKLANGKVIYCKGGGLWSSENSACIYMAVPNQGIRCAAGQSGCREYVGNTGNNVRNIFTEDFSNGTASGWLGLYDSTVSPSNASLTLGSDNRGHSILVTPQSGQTAAAERRVGTAVNRGYSYVLNFVAKTKNLASLKLDIMLANGMATSTFDASADLTNDWKIFEISLAELGHAPALNEAVILRAQAINQAFYINNITLKEIVDRYYLVKNSWKTPDACYYDLANAYQGPYYNLGCSQYLDRGNKTHNLRKFSELCSESAVGCELMIDTKNFSSPDQATFSADGSSVNVGADEAVYAVYDKEKLCSADKKGCQFLGQPYTYENTVLYGESYLKNDPDQYDQILCGQDAVGCQAFAYSEGEKYFKDPGDQVCERRAAAGQGASQDWYKKKIKRCDDGSAPNSSIDGKINASGNPLAPIEANICLSDGDCSIVRGKEGIQCAKDSDCGARTKCVNKVCRYACLVDNNDYFCPTDKDFGVIKTFGFGGSGNTVYQPAEEGGIHWAGVCPATESGCTEYVDPFSKFTTNIIFNGDFDNLDNNPLTLDGWSGPAPFKQNVILEPNTIYRLASRNNVNTDLKINCPGADLYIVNNGQMVIAPQPIGIDWPGFSQYYTSVIFYYENQNNDPASCEISVGNSANASVVLKPVIVDYQLSQSLDRQSCNGQVNNGQDCVLFNERRQAGTSTASLIWDADVTAMTNGSNPPVASARSEENDANIILKVAPDRACDKWLACKSYIKDAKGNNVCFDLGLCNAVDNNGNCQSFITSQKINQSFGLLPFLNASKISNLSGYAKAGLRGGSVVADYYPFGAMEQIGEVAELSNGNFEYYGNNLYPVGWNWSTSAVNKSWDVNLFSVINNPVSAQAEGTGYAPEGSGFLKLGSSYVAESDPIEVIPGASYIITAYINTINLKEGTAIIEASDSTNNWQVITQSLGNGWQFKMGKFSIPANGESTIRIRLSASAPSGAAGNFYFDDIKIKPALNSKTENSDCLPGYCVGGINNCSNNLGQACDTAQDKFWYTAQSCRLYPQSDSLSCDYYENSGIRQKGWPGYCLEYDRRPGDPNTCLLWYPIDKVKGDGIEEGAGYTDRTPLFYCTESLASKVYEYRHAFPVHDVSDDDDSPTRTCPPGYKRFGRIACWRWHNDNCDQDEIACVPEGDAVALDGSQNDFSECHDQGCRKSHIKSTTDGWYAYDGNLMSLPFPRGSGQTGGLYVMIDNSNKYADFLCNGQGITKPCPAGYPAGCVCLLTQELYRSTSYCSKLVQVVTATGQNKYWSSRVYKGSDYKVPELQYEYGTDVAPFGSMLPPALSSNPYDWDGQTAKDGIQPISYSTTNGLARSGAGYSCSPAADCGYIVDDAAQDNFPYAYGVQASPINPTKPVDLVKRLFVQNYGAWYWGDASSVNTYCLGTTNNCRIDYNDCPYGTCNQVQRKVCSMDNNISCKTCAASAPCQLGSITENRCGGTQNGAQCCLPSRTATSGATNCGGAVQCSKNAIGEYRCGGSGNLCCPSGAPCFVCADNKTIITGVPDADCSASGLICAPAIIQNSYYSCGGRADRNEICCSGDGGATTSNEGTCVPSGANQLVCQGGVNNGNICPQGQDCVNSECVTQTTIPAGSIKRYMKDNNADSNWGPPNNVCAGNPSVRRPYDSAIPNQDYCALLPTVTNIKVNGISGNVYLTNNQFIKLVFNTQVDSQQLPLVMYGVDWGDNSKTVVTGVEMRDKPDPAPGDPNNNGNPETIYHLYGYWDLKAKNSINQPSGNTVYCGAAGAATKTNNNVLTGPNCPANQACCAIRPKIQIKDNWDWCNAGKDNNNSVVMPAGINDCDQWEPFSGWVIVTEK